jgi:hypothetical protein
MYVLKRSLLAASLFTAVISGLPSISAASYSDFPFGSLAADIQNKLINQGQQQGQQQGSQQTSGAGIELPAADSRSGYRHIKIASLDVHAGVYAGWFHDASSFWPTLFGAGVTILPVVGTNVVSNRFAADEAAAQSMASLEIPAHASELSDWHKNDSVSYTVSGGLIFSVGIGYAMTGLSGDYYARGDWTTYVEKLDSQKVYVKITKVHLKDFDLMAGNILASEILSKFDKSDSFFSYIFDLSDPRAVPAYEAMIHGSMKLAELLSAAHPELAQLDLTEKGMTDGYQKRFFLGIPFLNISRTSGQLYNFSDTIFHSNRTESDVSYGLYWDEMDHNVISKHQSASQAFYGIAYDDQPLVGSLAAPLSGKYGKLILSYENDNANSDTIHAALAGMIKHTGLRQQLALQGPLPAGNLRYTNLSLTVVISEAATQQLLSESLSSQLAMAQVNEYFDHLGDPDGFCTDSTSDNAQECRDSVAGDVASAVKTMNSALKEMALANASHQNADFARAYANFGKSMLKNEMTFNLVSQLLGNQGIDITFQAMGTDFSMLTQKIVSDPSASSQSFLDLF